MPRSKPSAPPRAAPVAALASVLEAALQAFYALDSDLRLVFVNTAAEEYFCAPRDRLLGHRLWDIFPQARGTDFETACRLAMDARKPTILEARSQQRPGTGG